MGIRKGESMKDFFSTVGCLLFFAGLTILSLFWKRARKTLEDIFQSILAVADWEN
jgi:hypothetical protein